MGDVAERIEDEDKQFADLSILEATRNSKKAWSPGTLLAICSSTLPLSWLLIGSDIGALLAVVSIVAIVAYIHHPKASSVAFTLAWAGSHAAAFYWVWQAVAELSEQGPVLVSLFFLLFVAITTLHFPAFLYVWRALPRGLDRFALRSAVSWSVVEVLPLKIFPWTIGHTQIAILPIVQIAEFGGATLVSFLLFWVAEAWYLAYNKRIRNRAVTIPTVIVIGTFAFGMLRIHTLDSSNVKSISIALVQVEPNPETDGPSRYTSMSSQLALSHQAVTSGDIDVVVWPEASIPFSPSESVFNRSYDNRLPQLETYLLTGAETLRKPNKKFNSALLIKPDGEVPLPYHKRELIPFGEYIPYENTFPFLRAINPGAEGTTPGSVRTIFEVSTTDSSAVAKIAPLICYEDVRPNHAGEAVQKGANLLVGLSSDAWLGSNGIVGLWQHYTIARFRAIETRRSFVRSTTTGITAVIDATGREVARLPVNQEGVLKQRVALHQEISLYSKIGDTPWYILSIVVGLYLASITSLALARRVLIGKHAKLR